MKKKKYFGTDGIRGRVKEFPIVEDFFLNFCLNKENKKKYQKNFDW